MVNLYATGTAVPQHRIMQSEHATRILAANNMSRESRIRLRSIYGKSGIDSRYSVLSEFAANDESNNNIFIPSGGSDVYDIGERMELFETHASELSIQSVKNCLVKLPLLNPESITHVITFSCTGLFSPGLDILLVEKFGLNRDTERVCLNFMGCYAAVSALKTAWHICRSQPGAVVLLSGVELCTLHYLKSEEQDQILANALFADGAAAAIVSSADIQTNGNVLTLDAFFSGFEPDGSKDMVWRIGSSAFRLSLSSYVPALVEKNIGSLVSGLMQKASLNKTIPDFYAIHPGGLKILDACRKALNISHDDLQISYDILKDYGNMSSVTILFVLEKFMEKLSTVDHNKKMLACAFGPGLTIESVLLSVKSDR